MHSYKILPENPFHNIANNSSFSSRQTEQIRMRSFKAFAGMAHHPNPNEQPGGDASSSQVPQKRFNTDAGQVFFEQTADMLREPAMIEELRRTVITGQTPVIKLKAMKELSELKAKEAIPELKTALRDEDALIRQFAVKILSELKAKEAIPELKIALLKDKNETVRVLALIGLKMLALGTSEEKEIINLFINILKEDKSIAVRIAAISSLHELKAKEAIPQLIIALKRDKNKDVRAVAAETLGYLKAKEAIRALNDAAQKDTNNTVQSKAKAAIRAIMKSS